MPVYYEKPVQNKLSGLNTLAYMGTEATTPPQFYIAKRAPTVNDYDGWKIGSIWLFKGTDAVWMLTNKDKGILPPNGPATWTAFGGGASQFTTDNGIAYPLAGNINMLGGSNMHTEAVAPNADQVVMHLVDHPTVNALTISSLAVPGVVMVDGAGLLGTTVGTDGQVIVARAAGPVWANLQSTLGTVLITAAGNNINLEAAGGGGGGGGITGLTTDVGGTAIPPILAPFYVKIYGSDVIKTIVSAPDEVTIDVEDSAVAGNILFGGGVGNPSGWGTITSTGGSVTINVDPILKTINLEAAGVAALTGLSTDAGNAAPIAGIINIHGAAPITTAGAGNVVTVGLADPGVDGQVLISSSIGAPIWASIIGAGGITVTPNHNSITLTGGGGGGGGGIITLDCDNGTASDPGTHVVYIEGKLGTTNINHTTYPYKNIYTESLIGDPDLATFSLASSIQLPLTTVDAQAGVIMLGTSNFMHAYGTNNTFLGRLAGRTNAAVVVGTAVRNTAIGDSSYNSFTQGHDNTFLGYNTGTAVTTANYNVGIGGYVLDAHTTGTGSNTAIGYQALTNLLTGYQNTVIGATAGSALTGAEYKNLYIDSPGVIGEHRIIRIGLTHTLGAIGTMHTDAYMAGVHNGTVGTPKPQLVAVDVDGKLHGLGDATNNEILIGRTNADPVWGSLTSTNSSITITPALPNINIATNIPAFIARKVANTAGAVTGDGATYWLGSDAALFAVENTGGYLALGGGGTPATFTAPYTGLYSFTVQFETIYIVVPPPPPPPIPPPPNWDPIYVTIAGTSAATYSYSAPLFTATPASGATDSYTVVAKMTANDTATFGISIYLVPLALLTIIGGGAMGSHTWVTGHLVKML